MQTADPATLKRPHIKPAPKALYALLCTYAKADGTVTVPFRRVASDMGRSEDTIKRYRRQLEDAGVIDIDMRSDQGLPPVITIHSLVNADSSDREGGANARLHPPLGTYSKLRSVGPPTGEHQPAALPRGRRPSASQAAAPGYTRTATAMQCEGGGCGRCDLTAWDRVALRDTIDSVVGYWERDARDDLCWHIADFIGETGGFDLVIQTLQHKPPDGYNRRQPSSYVTLLKDGRAQKRAQEADHYPPLILPQRCPALYDAVTGTGWPKKQRDRLYAGIVLNVMAGGDEAAIAAAVTGLQSCQTESLDEWFTMQAAQGDSFRASLKAFFEQAAGNDVQRERAAS